MTDTKLVRSDSRDLVAPNKIDPSPHLPVAVHRTRVKEVKPSWDLAWFALLEAAYALSIAYAVTADIPLILIGALAALFGFHMGMRGVDKPRQITDNTNGRREQ